MTRSRWGCNPRSDVIYAIPIAVRTTKLTLSQLKYMINCSCFKKRIRARTVALYCAVFISNIMWWWIDWKVLNWWYTALRRYLDWLTVVYSFRLVHVRCLHLYHFHLICRSGQRQRNIRKSISVLCYNLNNLYIDEFYTDYILNALKCFKKYDDIYRFQWC